MLPTCKYRWYSACTSQVVKRISKNNYISGLVQGCGNYSVLAMEVSQSCTKLLNFILYFFYVSKGLIDDD